MTFPGRASRGLKNQRTHFTLVIQMATYFYVQSTTYIILFWWQGASRVEAQQIKDFMQRLQQAFFITSTIVVTVRCVMFGVLL